MKYFILPSTNIKTYEKITCVYSYHRPIPIISQSLSYYLYTIKEKIAQYQKDWDVYKKYTNSYEYINTSIPNKNKSVAKYKPLSRAYFKMIEIINIFHLKGAINEPINTFHLAEGPGGFIEAILEMRNNPNDKYIGMTILNDEKDDSIPTWKKSEYFLKKHPNVFIENGVDNTGNIISLENFIDIHQKYGGKMDFITADGGFDFSMDFNNQEINMTKLLFSQMAYALSMQKKGGHFVMKIFDIFMEHTIDILFILSSFYENVYISKPLTSRIANSEKYIICKNFISNKNDEFYPFLLESFRIMMLSNSMMTNSMNEIHIQRFLSIPIPYHFICKIEEYNAIFGQQQIENINYTLNLIEFKDKKEKIDSLVKSNIQKCVAWCIKHNIAY